MPWIIEVGHGCPPSRPWAVVQTGGGNAGRVMGCHPTNDRAKRQQAALYANESAGGMQMASQADDCGCDEVAAERAVDESAWDGSAAMSGCAGSDTPATCYRSICAGHRDGDPAVQATWALPHHKTPGSPPNADAVRAALSALGGGRGGVEGLTNREEAQRHLEAHMAAIQGGRSLEPTHETRDLFRSLDYELREESGGGPVLHGHFAVFNEWTEINSVAEGHFMERVLPGAFDRTFSEDRSRMRLLFNHGRDPELGNKVLGPIDVLRSDGHGAYYESSLFRGIPELLIEGLRARQYGASWRFEVPDGGDVWNDRPTRSNHNPDGLPERSIRSARILEFGPVTFPAYAGATAGLRSLTDELRDPTAAGRPVAGSAGGGEPAGDVQTPGHGGPDPQSLSARRALHTRLRILRETKRHA